MVRTTCPSLPMRTIDPGAGAIPQGQTAIFFGADLSPARWYERAPAIEVALYCDDGEPCRLDRCLPHPVFLAAAGDASLQIAA